MKISEKSLLKITFQGQIRSKMSELVAEISRLEGELANQEEEAESYLSYKRLAGQNATELADLQSRLADANMVIEKSNQGQQMITLLGFFTWKSLFSFDFFLPSKILVLNIVGKPAPKTAQS